MVDEAFEIGLGKAVEEEVRDDEVVGAIGRKSQRTGLVGGKALWCVGS